MSRYSRLMIALFLMLSGLALVPQTNLFAGVVTWHRFAGGYEDMVTITLARFVDPDRVAGDGILEVHASNTAGGNATLSVYRTSDNMYIGDLTFNGTDHRGAFPLEDNPDNITVRSSLGGGGASAPTPEIPTAVEVAALDVARGDDNALPIALALAGLTGAALFAVARRRR